MQAKKILYRLGISWKDWAIKGVVPYIFNYVTTMIPQLVIYRLNYAKLQPWGYHGSPMPASAYFILFLKDRVCWGYRMWDMLARGHHLCKGPLSFYGAFKSTFCSLVLFNTNEVNGNCCTLSYLFNFSHTQLRRKKCVNFYCGGANFFFFVIFPNPSKGISIFDRSMVYVLVRSRQSLSCSVLYRCLCVTECLT